MNKLLFIVVCSFGCLLLANCSQQQFSEPTLITIEVEEPRRLRFSGKGAGAGMMMSASMGPMGIAIGVAIDEGIGKEIDATARQKGFELDSLLSSCMSRALHESPNAFADGLEHTLRVQRYGFITRPSSDDLERVIPEWIVDYQLGDAAEVRLHYPKDFERESKDSLVNYAFERIKTDTDYVHQALLESSAQVCARFVSAAQ